MEQWKESKQLPCSGVQKSPIRGKKYGEDQLGPNTKNKKI